MQAQLAALREPIDSWDFGCHFGAQLVASGKRRPQSDWRRVSLGDQSEVRGRVTLPPSRGGCNLGGHCCVVYLMKRGSAPRPAIRPAVHVRADHFGRERDADRVTVGAQASHSGGNPMSQQTNAGFNAPGFSVVADDPAVSTPCASRHANCPSVSPKPLPFPVRSLHSARRCKSRSGSFASKPDALGVGHIAITCPDNFGSPRLFHFPLTRFTESSATGVCHSAITCAFKSGDFPRSTSVLAPSGVRIALSASDAVGVGHKPQPVPSVGRIDGRSRDNGRPAGVADTFHVSSDSVEPVLANRCRNLLSHEDSGPSGTGEAKQVGPQVPIVSLGFALAGDRERLARRGACPQFAVVWPSSKAGCESPASNPSEEMALRVSGKIGRCHIHDGTLINISGRQVPGAD